MVGPSAKRKVAGLLMEAHRLSHSRSCSLAGLSRSTAYYHPVKPYEGKLRDRLRELAQSHRRYGYLRIHYLLRKEGLVVNAKRTYRLYREERLQVYNRKGRKRLRGERVPLKPAEQVNQRWSLDFMSDSLCTGRRFRTLNIGDDFSRENRGILADFSISGERMARFLDILGEGHGFPEELLMDNVLKAKSITKIRQHLSLKPNPQSEPVRIINSFHYALSKELTSGNMIPYLRRPSFWVKGRLRRESFHTRGLPQTSGNIFLP